MKTPIQGVVELHVLHGEIAGGTSAVERLQSHNAEAGNGSQESRGQPSPASSLPPIEAVDEVTIPASLTARLYTSHFLSTWNSRLFEFGAVLFLAAIFPDTLLPLSIYAMVRGAAAILFAQGIGSWIDHGNRLAVVRTSIVGQRLAVAMSCAVFWAMEARGNALGVGAKNGLFAAAVVLGCIEKLCSVMNLVSVERDWVVVISEGNAAARRGLFLLALREAGAGLTGSQC